MTKKQLDLLDEILENVNILRMSLSAVELSTDERADFDGCTDTIIENVDLIKKMRHEVF